MLYVGQLEGKSLICTNGLVPLVGHSKSGLV
jgi:hypothetical protein